MRFFFTRSSELRIARPDWCLLENRSARRGSFIGFGGGEFSTGEMGNFHPALTNLRIQTSCLGEFHSDVWGEELLISQRKYADVLVGAPGFEPGASCAQGRRATRLRYAPTLRTLMILLYFSAFLPVI